MSSSGLNRDGLQALAKAVEAVETAGMRNGTSNNASSPSGIRSIFGVTIAHMYIQGLLKWIGCILKWPRYYIFWVKRIVLYSNSYLYK